MLSFICMYVFLTAVESATAILFREKIPEPNLYNVNFIVCYEFKIETSKLCFVCVYVCVRVYVYLIAVKLAVNLMDVKLSEI